MVNKITEQETGGFDEDSGIDMNHFEIKLVYENKNQHIIDKFLAELKENGF